MPTSNGRIWRRTFQPWIHFFLNQPLFVHCWTSAFLLVVHRLCGVIERRLSHFLPRWLRTGCDQSGKNPLKYSAAVGNWTRATGRTDSELSHWAIMTDLGNVWCAMLWFCWRCRNFPGLVNNTSIDWFFGWPQQALEAVAGVFISEDNPLIPENHREGQCFKIK